MNARKTGNKLFVVSGLITALAGAAPLVLAQAMPSNGLQQISGKILSVDPANHFLKLQAEKSALTGMIAAPIGFTLSADTIITEGARKLQPSDLQTGAVVQVAYKIEGGRQIAQSIDVQQPASAGAEAKPEEGKSTSQETGRTQAPSPVYR